jgi:hypothetical protein
MPNPPWDLHGWAELKLKRLPVDILLSLCRERAIEVPADDVTPETMATKLLDWKKSLRDHFPKIPWNLRGWAESKLKRLPVDTLLSLCCKRAIEVPADDVTPKTMVIKLLDWKKKQPKDDKKSHDKTTKKCLACFDELKLGHLGIQCVQDHHFCTRCSKNLITKLFENPESNIPLKCAICRVEINQSVFE